MGGEGRKPFINVPMYNYFAVQNFLLVFTHLNRDCFIPADLRAQDIRLSLQFTGLQKLYEDFCMKSLITVQEADILWGC